MPPERINENPETILNKINSAIISENYVLAMFLEHSTIESYLGELILINNQRDDGRVKEPITTFKRFTADILMSLDNILGLIDDKLYQGIKGFNSKRNKFVHNLIAYDFTEAAVKNEIKRLAKEGLAMCEAISKIYEDTLLASFADAEDFSDEFRGR